MKNALNKAQLNIANITAANKVKRLLWKIVWLLFFRPSPVFLHQWRCLLLRLFGANVDSKALPYPSAKIWAPWNLTMDEYSCLSHNVDCYCVDKIKIGKHATVSQRSFLCSATHDYSKKITPLPLMTAPINIESYSWVTSDVFIGPGVTIGKGSVVGVKSVVINSTLPWSVVAGNPAKHIKYRDILD